MAIKEIGDAVQTVKGLREESKRDRDQFSPVWMEVENQINLVPPEEWGDKDTWQTQTYLPLQAKAHESAVALLDEMMFGRGRWFSVKGIGKEDRKVETDLIRFMEILFELGRFRTNIGFVMSQAVATGTGYLKMTVDQSKKLPRLMFSFRNSKRAFQDPTSIVDFNESRYWMEEYNANIHDIVSDKAFDKKGVDELLEHLEGKSNPDVGDHIQMFSSEGDRQYQISTIYQEVSLIEYWGKLPVEKKKEIDGREVSYWDVENRVVTIADGAVQLRSAESDYGGILPICRMRVKRKLNHAYGSGLLLNGIAMQNIGNTIVNLGLDSAKLGMLPIRIFETGALANAASFNLRPLGEIELHPGRMEHFKIEHFESQSIRDMVNCLNIIDQQHQEATGITRHTQGAETVLGQEETLGQTQIKLQSAERRVYRFAKEITEEFISDILRKMFDIITDDKFIDGFQALADRILGPNIEPVRDAQTGQELGQLPSSKIDLKELKELELDFIPIGLTNFVQKSMIVQKLTALIQSVVGSEQMMSILNIEKVFRAIVEMSEIPDWEEYVKTDEELAMMQQQMQQMQMMQQQAGDEGVGVMNAAPEGANRYEH